MGSFIGTFPVLEIVPKNIGVFGLPVSFNDFVHVIEYENRKNKTT
jgi:hypothetical protein